METHWCQPWEVADVVPAAWVDRWRAVRLAEHEAQKGPKKVGGNAPGVKRTRVG